MRESFVCVGLLLPSDVLDLLSANAKRLYMSIWNRMAREGVTSLPLRNRALARYAHIRHPQLPDAQAELVRRRLLMISNLRPTDEQSDALMCYAFPKAQ